jgi:molecular chaperone DnaK (HSP70)
LNNGMNRYACGIDFGTSNSSIAIAKADEVRLVSVEHTSVTIPSAIFFQQLDNKAVYGRRAIEQFLDREPGRFMRSLKRVLGTSLMNQGTLVNGAAMNFSTIIAAFLKQLKHKAEEAAEQPIEQVVMGRPVHTLLAAAEGAKIALTHQPVYQTAFDFIEEGFAVPIERTVFDDAIQADIDKIATSARQCLRDAGVPPEAIELVILTGGTTEVPAIQAEFRRLFPEAAISDANKLSSVGLGLAYDSQKRFAPPGDRLI